MQTFGCLFDYVAEHAVSEDVLANDLELVNSSRLQVVDNGFGAALRFHVHWNPLRSALLSIPEQVLVR